MKKYIKYIPIVLLVVYPYLLPFAITKFISKYIIGLIILCLINFAAAFKMQDDGYYVLAKCNMIAKLLVIPFFTYVFICWMGVLFFSMFTIFGIIYVPMFGVVFLTVDVLLLITTSMYGIFSLIKAVRMQAIDKKSFVIYFIMHLLFVWDVLASILLFRKVKQKKAIS